MQHPISPLDGRYADRLQAHQTYFSEKALMQYRCQVEILYLLALDDLRIFAPMREEERLRAKLALEQFTEEDYQRVKEIERTTQHDVKACEIFLREKIEPQNPHLLHFGLTSEDVNNLAYNLLLKDYLQQVQIPQLETLLDRLAELAEAWKSKPFPTRTHGQKATPSTAGKELAVFLHRLLRVYQALRHFQFAGKLNGATGNYSALLAAFPQVDWPAFSKQFLQELGLVSNIATTQIEDHDTWAMYFNWTRQLNNIVMDLDVDCWLYISRDLLQEKTRAGEVGSSTMPHKVNPINFENSEGNLFISNSLLGMMSDKLCRSRMQRDLSDSTVQRNIGVALAHSYLAVAETLRGLNKLQLNETACLQELDDSPELLAEPIQTMLKLTNIADPYDLLKQATRGAKIQKADLVQLIQHLDIPEELRSRIIALDTRHYIGAAVQVCEEVLQLYRSSRVHDL